MSYFPWQHIQFEDESNPYICKTGEEFQRMREKYALDHITGQFWIARNRNELIK